MEDEYVNALASDFFSLKEKSKELSKSDNVTIDDVILLMEEASYKAERLTEEMEKLLETEQAKI